MRRMGMAMLALAALGGCDTKNGDYPRLLPIGQVLAEPDIPKGATATPDQITEDLAAKRARVQANAARVKAGRPAQTGLQSRAQALKARAGALRINADCGPDADTPCPAPATEN